MSKIFISYRRDDSAGYAQAIYGRLVQNFSKDRLFMDVDTIEPGMDFVRVIEKAVGECDVLLALIGRRWAAEADRSGSRINDTRDFVRLEISTALARDIRVIPVLVDGVPMPHEDTLPAPLRPLARRNAIEISNTRFNFDIERLITAVRNALSDTVKAESQSDFSSAETDKKTFREASAKRWNWKSITYFVVAVLYLSFVLKLIFVFGRPQWKGFVLLINTIPIFCFRQLGRVRALRYAALGHFLVLIVVIFFLDGAKLDLYNIVAYSPIVLIPAGVLWGLSYLYGNISRDPVRNR
jgi:hypothetical protein